MYEKKKKQLKKEGGREKNAFTKIIFGSGDIDIYVIYYAMIILHFFSSSEKSLFESFLNRFLIVLKSLFFFKYVKI